MSKLKSLSYHELTKKLKKLGFSGPYSGGKHLYMIKDSLRLTIPNPHRNNISIDLLAKILKHVGITREEWLEK
jgi:predicted RNA binding protein YcfA (HicA-like mRNA interferase family)